MDPAQSVALLRTYLADLSYNQRLEWISYLFENSVKNEDGTVTVPATLVERWLQQLTVPFDSTSDEEKKSNLIDADKVLCILYTFNNFRGAIL